MAGEGKGDFFPIPPTKTNRREHLSAVGREGKFSIFRREGKRLHYSTVNIFS
jgi:hypothetical protein